MRDATRGTGLQLTIVRGNRAWGQDGNFKGFADKDTKEFRVMRATMGAEEEVHT